MLCKSPYMLGVMPCACGGCEPCRSRRRRLWSHRIVLESLVHSDSSFVTLTYAPEKIPPDGSLQPKDLQDWLKRLRKRFYPRNIRYYLVGEYGDKSWRPHYHGALFGISMLEEAAVRETWSFGHIMLGELTRASASYIAGYVTKKMSNPKDNRLEGRHPEFARMSLKPGIGAYSMDAVALALMRSDRLPGLVDVPGQLTMDGQRVSIGRYLRRKLREKVGWSQETPPAANAEYAEKMRGLFKDALQNEALTSESDSWSALYRNMNIQKLRNFDARSKIFAQKRGVL